MVQHVTLTVDGPTYATIMRALDELPHREARPVVDAITTQVRQQLEAAAGPKTAEPPPASASA